MSLAESTHEAGVTRFAIRTRDPELANQLISDTYAIHHPQASGAQERFRFSLTSAAAGSIATDRMVHSMSTRTAVEPVRYLTASFLTRGRLAIHRGREEQRFGPGDVALYPYGAGFEARWDTMDLGLLRVDFDKIAHLASQSADIRTERFKFLSMRPVSPAMARYWRDLTALMHRELAKPQPTIAEPLVLAQAEAMLAAAVLVVFPNISLTAATQPRSGHVGPAALRRAVAYIDAHAGQPITLADIALSAGLGERALHQAFVRHHDTTPMRYLRQVRLELAHRELQAADPGRGDTVGKIALRWGFAKRGPFTESYRHAYGVNPSDTLRT